ncbi:S-layer homology domain-containing protein [Paenibacillus pabuli]|uniref:S-layer homology domain-containing protein n=1 Tax=Paenibacillus pabuli TaxID=1472 RepID=UPI003242C0E0
MRKGKLSKTLSVVLSASLLLGSLPFWGGGKAEASASDLLTYSKFLDKRAYATGVSDDGTKVTAFTGGSDSGYTFNIYDKSGNATPIEVNPTYFKREVEISPDGKYVAWIENGVANSSSMSSSKVRLLDLGTGIVTEVTKTGTAGVTLAFSPDSNKIVYSVGNVLYTYDISEQKQTALPSSISGQTFLATNPTLAYSDYAIFGPNSTDVYYTLANSSKVGSVYKWDGTASTLIAGGLNTQSNNSNPTVYAISSDGKYLLFAENYSGTMHVRNLETGKDENHSAANFRVNSSATFIGDTHVVSYLTWDMNQVRTLYNIDTKEKYYLTAGIISKDGSAFYSSSHYSAESGTKESFGYYDFSSLDLANINFTPLLPREVYSYGASIRYYAPLFYSSAKLKVNGKEISSDLTVGTSPLAVTFTQNIFSMSNVPYGPQDVEFTFYNSAGDADSINTQLGGLPYKTVTLGQETVDLGSFVNINYSLWRVVGDNTLLSVNSLGSKQFASDGRGRFSPTVEGNIAKFLNNDYYEEFTKEDKALIDEGVWQTYYPLTSGTPKAYQVTARIGMLNYEMLSAFPSGGLYFASTPWLMDAYDTAYSRGTSWWNNLKYDSYSTTTYLEVYPAIKVVSGVTAVEGSGDYRDPYTLTASPVVAKPTSPANLKVTTEETSLTANWDPVDGAKGYRVVVNNQQVYSGPNLSYVYTGLTANTDYTVDVYAYNDAGESSKVSLVVKTKETAVQLAAPGQPTAISTEAGNVQINWPASEGALIYKVQRNGVDIGSVATTSYVDKTAVMGESYIYTVKAFDGINTSNPSPILLVTVGEATNTPDPEPVVLDKPANFVLTPKTTSVIATWDAVSGASEYKLMRGNSIVYQGPLTTFSNSDLTEGTPYDYSVVAIKGDVVSEAATASTVTLVSQLAYPANFRIVTLEYNKVRLEWDQVDGAEGYQMTRDGMPIGTPNSTWWEDDATSISAGATYTYKVSAVKNGVAGKEAQKIVNVPTEPIQGEAPTGDLVLKATRVQHDRVGLSWTTVTGATYYDVYQDTENRVWHGELNTITDPNVGPEEVHTYKVVAGNEWGTLESNVIVVTTPSAPQSIVITPSEPMEGTITFEFKTVDGSYHYVERNPQTRYEPLPDGSFHKTYYNSATGELRDEGIVYPVNGKLRFSESGIDPSKDYHYDVIAVVLKADGTEEVVAREEVNITTPADGSGATVPGTIVDPTDPGNGGGTTDPGNGGGTTNPGNGGGTTDPGTTTPGTGGSDNGSIGGNTGGSTGNTGSNNSGSTGNTGSNNSGPTGNTGSNESTNDVGNSVPGTTGPVDEASDIPTDVEVPADVNFSDVENSFAKDAISYLAGKGIVKGYTDGTFNPDKQVTRAEFAIFLNRALGYGEGEYKHNFNDFDVNAWYAPELASALNNGITKGFTDGTYRPNDIIPREQAAVMLANIIAERGIEGSDLQYADAKAIIAWALDSVEVVTEAGVMSGYPGGKFLPKKELTRAEAAIMIYNLLQTK